MVTAESGRASAAPSAPRTQGCSDDGRTRRNSVAARNSASWLPMRASSGASAPSLDRHWPTTRPTLAQLIRRPSASSTLLTGPATPLTHRR